MGREPAPASRALPSPASLKGPLVRDGVAVRVFFLSIGWFAYGLSWFLRVVENGVTFPNGLPGWQAFWVAIDPLFPDDGAGRTSWFDPVSVASALTNLLVIASPLVLLRGSALARRRLGWALSVAFLVDAQWFLLSEDREALRIGYYFWCLAFVPLAIGFLGSRKSRIAEARPPASAV